MDFAGLAALLGIPLTAAPIAISLLSGRSPWHQLERAAKIAQSFDSESAEMAALRRVELKLIERMHDRLTISIERRAILLGAALGLFASTLGVLGATVGMIAGVFPSRLLSGITFVLLANAAAAMGGAIGSTAISLLVLRWIRRRDAKRLATARD